MHEHTNVETVQLRDYCMYLLCFIFYYRGQEFTAFIRVNILM